MPRALAARDWGGQRGRPPLGRTGQTSRSAEESRALDGNRPSRSLAVRRTHDIPGSESAALTDRLRSSSEDVQGQLGAAGGWLSRLATVFPRGSDSFTAH